MSDRLIGDFLELNAEIVSRREESKLPKFIKNIIFKHYHKRLIDQVNKLKESGYILNKSDLIEYFTYLYNNFPPYGTYQSTSIVKIYNTDLNYIEAVLNFKLNNNDCKALLSFEDEDKFSLVINIISDNKDNSFNTSLDELYLKDSICNEQIIEINNLLRGDICDYILSIIMSYK